MAANVRDKNVSRLHPTVSYGLYVLVIASSWQEAFAQNKPTSAVFNECAGLKCYAYIDKKMNWNDARDHCIKIGGFLAEIKNMEEYKLMEKLRPNTKDDGGIWLGGTDKYGKNDGHWLWDHSGETFPSDKNKRYKNIIENVDSEDHIGDFLAKSGYGVRRKRDAPKKGFHMWYLTEPNDAEEGEDCMSQWNMNKPENKQGYWNDHKCDGRVFPFVCQQGDVEDTCLPYGECATYADTFTCTHGYDIGENGLDYEDHPQGMETFDKQSIEICGKICQGWHNDGDPEQICQSYQWKPELCIGFNVSFATDATLEPYYDAPSALCTRDCKDTVNQVTPHRVLDADPPCQICGWCSPCVIAKECVKMTNNFTCTEASDIDENKIGISIHGHDDYSFKSGSLEQCQKSCAGITEFSVKSIEYAEQNMITYSDNCICSKTSPGMPGVQISFSRPHWQLCTRDCAVRQKCCEMETNECKAWADEEEGCFAFFTKRETWEGAKNYCKKIGGYLAEAKTRIVDQIIGKIAYTGKCGVWMGGSNRNGQWQWDKTGSAFSYSKWRLTKKAFGAKTCLMRKGDNGRWFDADCGTKTAFVCQKKDVSYDNCVGANCFALIKEQVTWHEAKKRCREYQGFLAEVRNVEEFHQIETLRTATSTGGVWLGGTDIRQEKHWRWNTSAVDFPSGYIDVLWTRQKFHKWRQGKPDGGSNSNCLAQEDDSKTFEHGKWHDRPCDSTKMEFVCQQQNGSGTIKFKKCEVDSPCAHLADTYTCLSGQRIGEQGVAIATEKLVKVPVTVTDSRTFMQCYTKCNKLTEFTTRSIRISFVKPTRTSRQNFQCECSPDAPGDEGIDVVYGLKRTTLCTRDCKGRRRAIAPHRAEGEGERCVRCGQCRQMADSYTCLTGKEIGKPGIIMMQRGQGVGSAVYTTNPHIDDCIWHCNNVTKFTTRSLMFKIEENRDFAHLPKWGNCVCGRFAPGDIDVDIHYSVPHMQICVRDCKAHPQFPTHGSKAIRLQAPLAATVSAALMMALLV